jgi:hypothetical protein
MEKIKKTVETVSEFGSQDDHGNRSYWVNFTDGNKGIFRTPNNDLFYNGQEAEFAIKEERESPKAGKFWILQRYRDDAPFSQPKQKQAINEVAISRSVAIKAVCELRATSNSKFTIQEIILEADEVFNYLEQGLEGVNIDKDKKDELPF